MSAKDNVVRFPPVGPVRVSMVRDWRAITPEDMLRCSIPADFNVTAARAAWEKWWSGKVHEMPMNFVDKKEYRQYVILRLANFHELYREVRKHPDTGIVLHEWPEWWAAEWSEGRIHHSRTFTPTFIPGKHEQQMKNLRQTRFWDLLEAGDPEAWQWPEGRSLLNEAGYAADELPPPTAIKRPYLPLPRRMKTRGERRRYRKLQEKSWQIAYGKTRKAVVKTLRRARQHTQAGAAVA